MSNDIAILMKQFGTKIKQPNLINVSAIAAS